MVDTISDVYNSGVDLRLFVKTYFEFIMDLCIYKSTGKMSNTKIPTTYKRKMDGYGVTEWHNIKTHILPALLELHSSIKYETNPRYVITAKLMIVMDELEGAK